MAGSQQHRCVFVGNIPYDATEEQLIQICEEVGPVVSFRLVVDRETGKPKGYGFCEYKDEETALSARRNLQGYEINGRQLRVDFAENDKGVDRNREQGRGGPGMAANVDGQKQGASAVLGDPLQQHHPIGLPSAMTAATVMAGALGAPQVLHKSNQNGWKNQSALGSDPLTLHLAKMSRNQLNGILCELKEMATQNKELARQLLDANPHLLKALFQAEIMLGMATPQMVCVIFFQNFSGTKALYYFVLFKYEPSLQDRQQVQQSAFQTLSGLPPLAQGNMQFGIVPRVQEGQAGAANYYSLVRSQLPTSSQPPPQAQVQVRMPDHDQFQQPMLPCQDDVSTDASLRPEFLPNVPIRPQTRVPISSSSSSRQPMHSLLQHSGQVGATNLDNLNARVQPSFLTQPPKAGSNFQLPSGAILGTSDWSNTNKRSSLPTIHPSKLAKLDGGRSAPLTVSGSNPSPATASWQPEFFGMGSSLSNQLSKAEEAGTREKQVQLPPEVESALLQQVVNLTPEQLRSLPSEQQHQVIQLQQMLR